MVRSTGPARTFVRPEGKKKIRPVLYLLFSNANLQGVFKSNAMMS